MRLRLTRQFNTVCIDFDNTIIPWGPIWKDAQPFPGVRDAVMKLREEGYYIYILTSRLSFTWCWESYKDFGYRNVFDMLDAQSKHITSLLRNHEIPYDEVGAEKVPALAYFDDLAIGVTPEYPLPAAIYDFIEGRSGE